jgi:hypothetical protein
MAFVQKYPIGVAGQAWGAAEKAAWVAQTAVSRTYQAEVLDKLEPLKADFDVKQYGALSVDAARFPLFAVTTKDWSADKPSVLVTGGVHGYETSGVQGALLFLQTKALAYAGKGLNVAVLPCVSPWGYERIQRWSHDAVDPNRSFNAERRAEEAAAVMDWVAAQGVAQWLMHVDCHETTDSDSNEFCPAKAARDGVELGDFAIPDGFFLVGDTENPQPEWHAAMIAAVKAVTHIAPADAKGQIIEADVTQEGTITYPLQALSLCASVTNAAYATTTEVYPDSAKATAEQCNRAQVACIAGGLDFLIAKGL